MSVAKYSSDSQRHVYGTARSHSSCTIRFPGTHVDNTLDVPNDLGDVVGYPRDRIRGPHAELRHVVHKLPLEVSRHLGYIGPIPQASLPGPLDDLVVNVGDSQGIVDVEAKVVGQDAADYIERDVRPRVP